MPTYFTYLLYRLKRMHISDLAYLHLRYNIKPNPAALSTSKPNWEALRLEIRDILEITKDNHSLGASPENVVIWCRIAKEESKRMVS